MLRTCRQSHTCCSWDLNGASPYTPRRLISIGSQQEDLRLIEIDEGDEKSPDMYTYAALSYCWGTSGKNYKTTHQNLATHKIRLPRENLPAVSSLNERMSIWRTAKPAGHPRQLPMLYTFAKFKIPYLWVDAISIFQGDRKDWEEQSGEMRDVYSHCVVALATEDTEDCDSGFLPRISPKNKGKISCSGNQDQILRT